MTSVSGSDAAANEPVQPDSRDSGGLKIRRFLARALLLIAGAMSWACPYPDFGIDLEENQAPVVDESLLLPKESGKQVKIDVKCGELQEFDITAAVSDPEDDDLYVVWYLDFDEGVANGFQGEEMKLELSACDVFSTFNKGVLTLEAFVMDREPSRVGGLVLTVPADDDGLVVRIPWTLVFTEVDDCTGC